MKDHNLIFWLMLLTWKHSCHCKNRQTLQFFYRFLLSTAFVQHTTVKNNKRRRMWNYSFWKTKFVQIVSIEEEAQRLSSGNICWNFGFWTYFIVKTWKTLTVNRQCKYLHLMTQSEISFYITSNGQSSKFRTNQTLVASCWS